MPTLLDFRRRIRSVKNTQQITRAMKFVAAAHLRRAQERVFAARPYAQEMFCVLRSAIARVETPVHSLLLRRPEERVLVLVVTGDKGLCGAFNTNVIRKAVEFVHRHAQQQLGFIPVGKKARNALGKRKWKLITEYIQIAAAVEFSKAKEIAARVIALYSDAEVDAVYAIYNEFKSVLAQRLVVEKLLPIDPELFLPGAEERARVTTTGPAASLPLRPAAGGTALLVDYLYEQPPAEIFNRLLPRHVETQVYRVLLESSAAENAARMTSMDAATNNAAELIDQVTLQMNKIRQATITKEIIEVVSGAAWTA